MATRWDSVPKLTDDVVKSAKEDLAKGQKGRNVNESSLRGGAKEAVREAGRRAENRNFGRAALAGAALQGGYEMGRALDEKTGLGKKMVDKSGLGDLAEEMAKPSEKVELSEESKARIARGDLDEKSKSRAYKDSEGGGGGARSEPKNRALMENREPKDEAMKRGGAVKKPQYMSFSKTGKPAGMRNVTKMASGGVTASRRADGIAQRGKTRGKMC